MELNSRIFVAGHRGLVGSAICDSLKRQGYNRLQLRSRDELDLSDYVSVNRYFESEQPEYVFLAAAKVGGILANKAFPADFIHANLLIQTSVISAATKINVKRMIFLGSSSIYPKDAPQPMKEADLLTGPLEPTNRPYALAKIAGIEECWSYNRQYGTKYIAAMPTNLYGPGDHYEPNNSHVLPALLRKIAEAKAKGASEVVVWGTGEPLREFLFSADMADACVFLANLPDETYGKLIREDEPPLVNVGSGEELSIRALAEMVSVVVGYHGSLVFDTEKPNGVMRKLMDSSKITSLGWAPKTPLAEGIKLAYEDAIARSVFDC